MTSERHVLHVSDADLEELRSRLSGTRWPQPWPRQEAGGDWLAGTSEGELRRLVRYWADGYDWRYREAEINALPGHVASVDGAGVFYCGSTPRSRGRCLSC
ncbi:epoxide hydrolase N-terminal domain-containing protein [Nonomuraea helvata]|uniref:Epoxide hydrolase N-terminal domain-containing protein n=1 Tax=Nonomuraea helvata TaxID=37484 RepID=A0ABV5RTJ6_9ACTN